MRNLNLDEISDKINDYSLDIRYSDIMHLDNKVEQFLNFLFVQPISSRIIQRIEEDFDDVKNKIVELQPFKAKMSIRDKLNEFLLTREMQGAFGYFEIKNKFYSENKKRINHYIELSRDWYHFLLRGDFHEYQDNFYTYFFEPFIELLKWYIYESTIKNDTDFYSFEEIKIFEDKIISLENEIKKLGFGQEIIFNEADEIKSLVKGLSKKNLFEIIKGKFIYMALSKTITINNAKMIIKSLTGEDLDF